MKEETKEILESLLDMYGQYCDDGHSFMSAGERAMGVLERNNVATFDGAGRIVKVKKPYVL